jgi:hypothetical protein
MPKGWMAMPKKGGYPMPSESERTAFQEELTRANLLGVAADLQDHRLEREAASRGLYGDAAATFAQGGQYAASIYHEIIVAAWFAGQPKDGQE